MSQSAAAGADPALDVVIGQGAAKSLDKGGGDSMLLLLLGIFQRSVGGKLLVKRGGGQTPKLWGGVKLHVVAGVVNSKCLCVCVCVRRGVNTMFLGVLFGGQLQCSALNKRRLTVHRHRRYFLLGSEKQRSCDPVTRHTGP